MVDLYRIRGHLIALFTIVIWSTTYISTKVLLTDFKPIEILFFRFVLGYFTLWIMSPRVLRWQGVRQELLFMAAGFCGVTCYFLCENVALTYTTASNVAVIACLAPVFTAILAIFFVKIETPPLRFYFGCLLAVFGVAFISFNGQMVLSLNPLGDILAVVACLFWAAYSILTKLSSNDYSAILLTRRFFFYGLIFMLPALYLFDFQLELVRFAKLSNVLNILFLGLVASAISFASWNYAVCLVGAVRISLYIYLVPPITIITAVIILHESFNAIAAIGTILTLAGVLLSDSKLKLKRQ